MLFNHASSEQLHPLHGVHLVVVLLGAVRFGSCWRGHIRCFACLGVLCGFIFTCLRSERDAGDRVITGLCDRSASRWLHAKWRGTGRGSSGTPQHRLPELRTALQSAATTRWAAAGRRGIKMDELRGQANLDLTICFPDPACTTSRIKANPPCFSTRAPACCCGPAC